MGSWGPLQLLLLLVVLLMIWFLLLLLLPNLFAWVPLLPDLFALAPVHCPPMLNHPLHLIALVCTCLALHSFMVCQKKCKRKF